MFDEKTLAERNRAPFANDEEMVAAEKESAALYEEAEEVHDLELNGALCDRAYDLLLRIHATEPKTAIGAAVKLRTFFLTIPLSASEDYADEINKWELDSLRQVLALVERQAGKESR